MSENEHQCEKIPANGVAVLTADHFLQGPDWQWCLVVERQATEQDLEDNPALEEVGETLWSTAVGISHCPFCGHQLTKTPEPGQPVPAEYVHVDSSGWQYKVQ